jgi:hypothetical protein
VEALDASQESSEVKAHSGEADVEEVITSRPADCDHAPHPEQQESVLAQTILQRVTRP